MGSSRARLFLAVAIFIGWAVPVVLLSYISSHAPSLLPVEARQQLGGDLGSCSCPAILAKAGSGGVPVRTAPWYEQWLLILTGFVVKPFYMLLALVLAFILRERKEPELAALRWGLISFFVGESFCAVNFFIFHDSSYFSEYLHSYGMVLSFAFFAYVFLEGLDRRMLYVSDPKHGCAAASLCEHCAKAGDTTCGLQRIFQWLTPAMLILGLIPLSGTLRSQTYDIMVFGVPYRYWHSVVYQIYEDFLCPLAAAGLFTGAFLVLTFKKSHPIEAAKIFFCAGTGFMLFGIFRFILINAYFDNQFWFGFWEEITETLMICAIALILWVFRARLLAPQTVES